MRRGKKSYHSYLSYRLGKKNLCHATGFGWILVLSEVSNPTTFASNLSPGESNLHDSDGFAVNHYLYPCMQ